MGCWCIWYMKRLSFWRGEGSMSLEESLEVLGKAFWIRRKKEYFLMGWVGGFGGAVHLAVRA